MTKILALISGLKGLLDIIPTETRQRTLDSIFDAIVQHNPKLKPTFDLIRTILNIPDFEEAPAAPASMTEVG